MSDIGADTLGSFVRRKNKHRWRLKYREGQRERKKRDDTKLTPELTS